MTIPRCLRALPFPALAALALAALALAGRAPPAAAQGLDKVTVGGWSQPISEITNLLAEPDHGLFKARGIALDYVPGNGGGSAIQAVLAGQAMSPSPTRPRSTSPSTRARTWWRSTISTRRTCSTSSRPRAAASAPPPTSRAKRVGVYSLASGTRQHLLLLLAAAGLKESDVTVEVTGLLNFAP